MNIVFITPAAWYKRNPIYRTGGKFYGHSNAITGPLILGGILRRAGHSVEVYEELNGSIDYDRLIKRADVLCLYCMTSTSTRAYELADLFHEKGHAHVLIGGIHATAMPQEALEHADQVVTGEGEQVILDVVEGRRPEPIVIGKPIEDLDTVPFPDYSILRTPCKAANIMTSRGCPFRCTFCTTSRMFAPYRKRSVESVIEEIRWYHALGFKYMNFEDDNFTADKERAKEICRRIIAENLQFKETFFFGRTDMAEDEELLTLLAQAHLTRVLIGIESLNQKALDSVHKGQSIADIERAAYACRDHGIRVIASLVLGLDDDGREDIRRSVDFAKSIDAYQIQPAILTPFPQTPVYQQLCSEGRMIPGDWDRFDMTNVTFQPKQLSPWELQEEFARAGNVFYDFPSALRIGKLFGIEYFWRRFYLAAATSLGPGAMHFVADHVPQSYYYVLKHTPWMFAPEAAPETAPATAYARTAVNREDGDMISGLSEHLRRGVRQLESTAEIVTAGVMNIARITGRLLQSISQGPISTVSDSSTAKNSISSTASGDGAAKGALPLSHIASLASLQESRRLAVQKQLDDFKALNARIEDANARIRQADQRIEVQVEVLGKTIRDRVDPPRMIAIPTN